MTDPRPIFFGWARSFWFGILPALLAAIDMLAMILADPEAGPPVAALLAMFLPADVATIEAVLRAWAPLAVIYVSWERRGQNRPYTAHLSRETL